MRIIKEVGEDYIEEYLDIYLHAYPAYKAGDAECRERYRKKTLFDMRNDKKVDFVGMFEGEKLLATMKLVNFDMNIYGKIQPAVGVMALEVHPIYKKQGIAFEMMKYYEDYSLKKGALVTVLLPFNMPFYRKMGYGFGSKLDEYHIPTENLPRAESQDRLKLLSMDDIDEVLNCYDEFAEDNHGMLKRFEEEEREIRGDTASIRVGYYGEGGLQGYIAYNFVDAHESNYTKNTLVVDEMVYKDGRVLKELLGYLHNQAALAQTVVIRSGEAEFYHLLDDPTDVSEHYIPYGYLQTNVSAICNMYKVLDLERFIKATGYRKLPPVDLRVCFEYYDEMYDNRGRLSLEIKREGEEAYSHWQLYQGGQADVHVRCKKADLSSVLLNSARIGPLLDLGVMEVDREELVPLLDIAFYNSQKPYSNADF